MIHCFAFPILIMGMLAVYPMLNKDLQKAWCSLGRKCQKASLSCPNLTKNTLVEKISKIPSFDSFLGWSIYKLCRKIWVRNGKPLKNNLDNKIQLIDPTGSRTQTHFTLPEFKTNSGFNQISTAFNAAKFPDIDRENPDPNLVIPPPNFRPKHACQIITTKPE